MIEKIIKKYRKETEEAFWKLAYKLAMNYDLIPLEFIENLLRLIIGTILGVAVMAMVMPIYIIGQILEKIKKRDKK